VVVEADPSQIDDFQEWVVEQVVVEADLSQIDNFQEQQVLVVLLCLHLCPCLCHYLFLFLFFTSRYRRLVGNKLQFLCWCSMSRYHSKRIQCHWPSRGCR
jgi:hypothetical protein